MGSPLFPSVYFTEEVLGLGRINLLWGILDKFYSFKPYYVHLKAHILKFVFTFFELSFISVSNKIGWKFKYADIRRWYKSAGFIIIYDNFPITPMFKRTLPILIIQALRKCIHFTGCTVTLNTRSWSWW